MKRGAQITSMGPREILGAMGPGLFRDAAARGMGLSPYLELMNPSDPNENSELDAFSRVLKQAGIITRTLPEAGVYADTWEDAFEHNPLIAEVNADHAARIGRSLAIEWCVRKYRESANAGLSANTRQVFTSSDAVSGTWLAPIAEAAQARVQALTPAIPLSDLVAITTPIETNTYRAAYVVDTANTGKRFVRVGETAEIPRITLVTSERTVTLYKYGRALESSYEVLRRQRLDRVALLVQLMAIQAEVDKVETALNVLISGDGNAATAAQNHNLTTLDPAAVAGTLTLKGWLAFKMQFNNPYTLTTMLANQGVILQTQLLSWSSANQPLVTVQAAAGFGGLRPIGRNLTGDNVAYGVTSAAPALKIVGFDSRVALERITEVGSAITEIERYITKQTEVLAMTEVEGYAVIDPRATRVLDINA